jgi:hypothetical protein
VAAVHVAFVSHRADGADPTVTAPEERECPPEVNVVDVAVTFQPVPEPVASLTSIDWLLLLIDSSRPVRFVAGKETFAGAETNANDPAFRVAVALTAPAGAEDNNTIEAASAAATAVAILTRVAWLLVPDI